MWVRAGVGLLHVKRTAHFSYHLGNCWLTGDDDDDIEVMVEEALSFAQSDVTAKYSHKSCMHATAAEARSSATITSSL